MRLWEEQEKSKRERENVIHPTQMQTLFSMLMRTTTNITSQNNMYVHNNFQMSMPCGERALLRLKKIIFLRVTLSERVFSSQSVKISVSFFIYFIVAFPFISFPELIVKSSIERQKSSFFLLFCDAISIVNS